MRGSVRIFRTTILLLSLWGIAVSAGGAEVPEGKFRRGDAPGKRVLLVSSYSQFFSWTSELTAGLLAPLRNRRDPVEVRVLELDALRNPDRDIMRRDVREALGERRYDIVIAADPPAIALVASLAELIPAAASVVYCGMIHYDPELIRKLPNVTCVQLPLDVEGTVRLGLRLLPRSRTVAVIVDESPDGRILQRRMRLLAKQLPTVEIKLLNGEKLMPMELFSRLAQLPERSFVVYAARRQHPLGRRYQQTAYLIRLQQSSPGPIFALTRSALETGAVLGGVVTPGRRHGAETARLVERILNGTPAASLPWSRERGEILINWRMMQGMGIPESRAPDDAIFLNRPPERFNRSTVSLIGGLAGVAVLLTLGTGLLVFGIRYRRSERCRLQEKVKTGTLLEMLPLSLGVLNGRGEYLYFNLEREMRRRWKIPYRQTLTIFDVFCHDFASYLLAVIDIADRAGLPLELEYIYDGKWMRMGIRALPDEVFGEPAVVFVSSDRTAHREREREREMETERCRCVLEAIGEGVVATDGTGVITLFNPGAEQLTGYSAREVVGKPFGEVWKLWADHGAEHAESALLTALRDGRAVDFSDSIRLIARDGSRREIMENAAPIYRRGELSGIVMACRDATAETRMRRRLGWAEALLAELVVDGRRAFWIGDRDGLILARFQHGGGWSEDAGLFAAVAAGGVEPEAFGREWRAMLEGSQEELERVCVLRPADGVRRFRLRARCRYEPGAEPLVCIWLERLEDDGNEMETEGGDDC